MPEPTIAKVAVDMPLPHLDRFFDYAIPEALSGQIRVGCRVRVRFAGRLRDGFVIDLPQSSDAGRELAPLQRVVSAEPVLHPELVPVLRAVADHYAGTFSDVARLAVPPRHGVTEKAEPIVHPPPRLGQTPVSLPGYPHGPALVAALSEGGRPRAAITLAPVHDPAGDWQTALLELAEATLTGGRGALLLVPDQRDLTRLATAATARFGRGSFVTLSADAGPAARYRAFLAASRGGVWLVLGTRAAAFAPVADLGLIALYDDGDDSWAEPRAPYPHARTVAVLRAAEQGCALALVGYGRTAEVQQLSDQRWLVGVEAPPARRRELCPIVRVATDTDLALERDPGARSRLPHAAFDAIRAGLAIGPVLIQVPRAGYLAALSCFACREPSRCPTCDQPLAGAPGERGRIRPECRWCGPQPQWRCRACGGTALRAPRIGVERTADELGRAFPQTRVVRSSADHIVDQVSDEPAIVLATPGAEPVGGAGYAAAILLDAELLLSRPDLRAGEEALRRWLAATSLVRPAAQGGTVVLVGDPASRAVQALVRLDPVGYAERELDERAASGFPPAATVVTLDGPDGAVAEAIGELGGVAASVLGPTPLPGHPEQSRVTLRVPRSSGRELVAAVKRMAAARSSRKADGSVRARVDPAVL